MSITVDAPAARKMTSAEPPESEGVRTWVGPFIALAYHLQSRLFRSSLLWLVKKLERGELYSLTLRQIFREYHGVSVGLYTEGAPFVVNAMPRGAIVGRFCSIFWTVRAFNANHPMNLKSTHALFYNPLLGLVDRDTLSRPSLVIGNDVWIGHNAIILPSVRRIGDGAVLGAGSVVHEDVPPYAIVVGHPGRVVRYRFRKEIIQHLLATRWWDKPLHELAYSISEFQTPLDAESLG